MIDDGFMFRHQKLAVQKVFSLENLNRADTLAEISYHFSLFSKPFLFLQMSHVCYRCPCCSQLLIFHIDHRMVEVGKTSGNNLLQAGSVREAAQGPPLSDMTVLEDGDYKTCGQPVALLECSGIGKYLGFLVCLVFSFLL